MSIPGVGGDGKVLMDGEHIASVGDHSVGDGYEVGQGVSGAVARAGPLSLGD